MRYRDWSDGGGVGVRKLMRAVEKVKRGKSKEVGLASREVAGGVIVVVVMATGRVAEKGCGE